MPGVQASSPTPAACLSATTPTKGQLPQREQPRSDATVNTQLVRACPRHGTNDPPKINPKQQIRHNQHAATHTVQFFLQTRFNERIEREHE